MTDLLSILRDSYRKDHFSVLESQVKSQEGRKWSGRLDLNQRPPRPERGALPV
jgi:hypothetical protein